MSLKDAIWYQYLKAHGKKARASYLLNGHARNTGRAAQGMHLRVGLAKIACLDFNLQKTKTQLGIQLSVTNPRDLEKFVRGCQFVRFQHLLTWKGKETFDSSLLGSAHEVFTSWLMISAILSMLVLNNTAEASDAETASEMATVGSPRPMRGLGVTWYHTPSDYRREKETMEAEPAYIKKERSNDV
ncbi:hypothetical protein WN943_019684 [Citrus x changshan-huyou]